MENLRGALLGLRGIRNRQNAHHSRPHRMANSTTHTCRADSGGYLHQQSRRRNARSHLLGKRQNSKQHPEISTSIRFACEIFPRQIQPSGIHHGSSTAATRSIARQVLRELRVAGERLRPGDLLYSSAAGSSCLRPEDAIAAPATDKEHLASGLSPLSGRVENCRHSRSTICCCSPKSS